MKIEAIKKIDDKYKILLDTKEVLIVTDRVIIENNLLYDKKITPKLLEKINKDTKYYEIYNQILKKINRKLRSEYEIRKILEKSEIDVDKMIKNLKEIGLIDDKLYAESYTNDKINLSLDGPYKIKKHLEENKIEDIYIEEALNKFTQTIIDQRLTKIVNKRLKTNKDTPYIFKQKTFIYLSNLGYQKEDIVNHLENIKIDNSKFELEMEKIYQKLKSKYEGYTLYNKLKQKLYTKGYNIEEINEFIQKNSS